MHNYLPHTNADREKILKNIGISSIEDLLRHIPQSLRYFNLNINNGLSEIEVVTKLQEFANKNKHTGNTISFLGGGVYNRFIPSIVPYLASRSEFLTAYTPYQPEASQGSLQAIYEYQTSICNLTGMDVSNASMYDGASASAEAVLMALRIKQDRNQVVVLETVNPEYRQVIQTYLKGKNITYTEAGFNKKNLVTCREDLKARINGNTACLVVQVPNFFGAIEQINELRSIAHEANTLFIAIVDGVSLGLLTPPSEYDADIVVGDGQCLGIPVSFGGPSFGFFACKQEYVRQMPGRIAGMTIDGNGKRAFTLTLQAREQHIKRSRATSNICTNQALMALMGLMYMSTVGPQGLQEIARLSYDRAHYLANKLTQIDGLHLVQSSFTHEFVIELDHDLPAEDFLDLMLEYDILAGIQLNKLYPKMGNCIMLAVTEMNSVADINYFVSIVKHTIQEIKRNKVAVHG